MSLAFNFILSEILSIQRSQFSLSPIEGEGDDFFRFATTKG